MKLRIESEDNKFYVTPFEDYALCDEDTMLKLCIDDDEEYYRLVEECNGKVFDYPTGDGRVLSDSYFLTIEDAEMFKAKLTDFIIESYTDKVYEIHSVINDIVYDMERGSINSEDALGEIKAELEDINLVE